MVGPLFHALILGSPKQTRNSQYFSWLWAVSALPLCPSEGWGQFYTALRNQHVSSGSPDQGHPSGLGGNRHLLVQGHVWVHVSTGQNPVMVPGRIASDSHQAIPNNLQSPSLPLFIVPSSFCFSFSSISPSLTCSS